MAKKEQTLEERGAKANQEIMDVLKKYDLQIQPQIEKEDLDTFVSALKVRLIDNKKDE